MVLDSPDPWEAVLYKAAQLICDSIKEHTKFFASMSAKTAHLMTSVLRNLGMGYALSYSHRNAKGLFKIRCPRDKPACAAALAIRLTQMPHTHPWQLSAVH